MENASKALIIAGAILISILLISLGIMVYNQARGTIDESNLDSEAVQTFNAKFDAYLGEISGNTANALVTLCNANGVTLDITESTTDGIYGTNNNASFSTSKKYIATVTERITDNVPEKGQISKIKIAKP